MPSSVFHLAISVDDLEKAEVFYGNVIGCARGRRSDRWIDFDFFGHQLVTHLDENKKAPASTSAVDGKQVPVNHFGIVLDRADWETLSQRLKDAGVEFIIEPGIRFKGEPGEQGTYFLLDPAGNALEFKYFNDRAQLFAT